MSSGNNHPRYTAAPGGSAGRLNSFHAVPSSGQASARNGVPGSYSGYHANNDPKAYTSKAGVSGSSPSKSKLGTGSAKVSSATGSSSTSGGNRGTSKSGSTNKSGGSASTTSRQVPGNTALEFNTPVQNQMLAQCDYIDRTIWATRVLWGGNAVNGFLRATATAQRIKKQRARQNNSTKQNRAAKAASSMGGPPPPTGDKKGIAGASKTNPSTITGSTKLKEVFNQHEEELLKKEIMNPRTAKKLKGELETGLTFCATVCNVLRGVLFDIDPSLSPSLPQHLSLVHEKPPPAHTFLVPSPPPAGVQLQKPSASSTNTTGSTKLTKGASKSSKNTASGGIKGDTVSSKTSGSSKQHQISAQTNTSSPGDPGTSTLRRLRKTSKKNKLKPIATREPGFANLPPEFDPSSSNKRTCTKKEYQHRVFQLLRYRDLKPGDFCAARLSSRDLWILAKVLKDYKTTTLAPTYSVSPLDFLSLSDTRRDALFQKEKVVLEDVEDQQASTAAAQVTRSLVLPLPRSPAEANDWAARLLKKGSRVYAMYPQTTSLYAATVTDSTTYCRGEDDIIVVQFDGEEADLMTGQVPSYHIPARFVTLIPREFPASQSGRTSSSSTSKSTSGSVSTSTTSGTKRKSSSTATSSSNTKRKSTSSANAAGGGDGFLDTLALDFAGGDGGFDDLDLDFDKPLDEHEQQATQEGFSPF